jgi:hypothetical protein
VDAGDDRAAGELAVDGVPEQPRFSGYLLDEYSLRPAIWSTGQQPFRFEESFPNT